MSARMRRASTPGNVGAGSVRANAAGARGLIAAAVAVVLACAACGGPDDTMTSSARRELTPFVTAVRHDVGSFDPGAAAQQLASIRMRVASLRHAGKIGDARADAILNAVRAVEDRLTLAPTTTTSTTTTTTTTRPPARGPGNGKGKKGQGGDQGDGG
jgi:hypothetical protein